MDVPTCANNPEFSVPTCANNPTPGKWPYQTGSLIIEEDEEDYCVQVKDEDSISTASTIAL